MPSTVTEGRAHSMSETAPDPQQVYLTGVCLGVVAGTTPAR